MGKSALAIGKEVLSNADVIVTTAYNAGKPNLKEFAKEVGKNADYIYNGVMRVASACKEDEVEISSCFTKRISAGEQNKMGT